MKILPKNLIPAELWNSDVLHIPALLTSEYINELTSHGLLAAATSGVGKAEILGGFTKQETLDHFAYRYAVSVGRIEFCSLDPNESLSDVSDALLSTFSDGHVSLLDIPCGTGALSCGFLCTLAVLRRHNLLPRLPLTVTIVGGDYSRHALKVYFSMLKRLKPLLSSQGITIKYHLHLWDATKGDQTARLIDKWFLHSATVSEYVVAVSNFSGTLTREKVFEEFKPCFEQILSRLYGKKKRTLIWLEPSSKSAQNRLIPKIIELIKTRISSLFTNTDTVEGFLSARYRICNPLNNGIHDSNLEVKKFKRDK